MLDLSGVANYADVVVDYVPACASNCFGLTATTPQMPQAACVAEVIKQARPEARLILGGPHVTLTHAAAKREWQLGRPGRAQAALIQLRQLFHVLVCGDGELAVMQAVKGRSPIIDADDPKSGLFLSDKTYDESPWPARELLDMNSYHYEIEGAKATSLIAQLGCPFPCGFCSGRNSPFLRRIRMRTSDNIAAEMEHLYKTYGYTGFMFYDDEMNVNKNLVELMNKIADLQDRLGVSFKLRGFLKSQLFTDKQAAALYRAGFRWVLVGFESGSDKILKNINKKATKDQNTRCIEIATRHNLKTKALMSLGHPGESWDTIQETRDWLCSVKPADFDATVITTYPGSPYYDDAVPSERHPGDWEYEFNGDRLYEIELDYTKVADYYKGDPEGGYRAYVYTDYLTPENLVQLRNELEKDIRAALNIKYNPSVAARKYEHSMGQLPPDILRRGGTNG